MRSVRFFAIIIIAVLLIGCATANRFPKDYSGPDAGYLIVSLGATPKMKLTSYSLFFRKKGDDRQGLVHYKYDGGIFPGTDRDFDDSTEHGFVDVQKLPAGEYELVNFQAYLNLGSFQQSYWSAKTPFSIPFTIEPGIATYIGDYMAAGVYGKNIFGMRVVADVYFVVSDKKSRDVPLAEKKEPLIKKVHFVVPDAIRVGHPLIKATLEQKEDEK